MENFVIYGLIFFWYNKYTNFNKIYNISMSISFKFNYITYKINKMIIFYYLPIKNIVNKRDKLFLFM